MQQQVKEQLRLKQQQQQQRLGKERQQLQQQLQRLQQKSRNAAGYSEDRDEDIHHEGDANHLRNDDDDHRFGYFSHPTKVGSDSDSDSDSNSNSNSKSRHRALAKHEAQEHRESDQTRPFTLCSGYANSPIEAHSMTHYLHGLLLAAVEYSHVAAPRRLLLLGVNAKLNFVGTGVGGEKEKEADERMANEQGMKGKGGEERNEKESGKKGDAQHRRPIYIWSNIGERRSPECDSHAHIIHSAIRRRCRVASQTSP
jgi:hypothetical protein